MVTLMSTLRSSLLFLCALMCCRDAVSQGSKSPNYQGTSTSSPLPVHKITGAKGGCTAAGQDGRFTFENGGQLGASVGDLFSGQIAHFQICSGNGVIQWGDRIFWGDGADDPMGVPDPFYQGRLVAS